jgi:putative sigma-54 modulation protein
MLIQVSGKGLELNPEFRDYVEDRIGSALDRFSTRIGRVNVFLEDVNGPKSGIDKSIRVVIDIARIPLIVVEEKGESWHAILVRTTERTVHTVSRQVDRIRSRTDHTSMAGDVEEALDIELDEKRH